MKHKDKITEHIVQVISADANLIIDLLGIEVIKDAVAKFDDDDLRYYFKKGYTGWNSVDDLIEELDAEGVQKR